MASSLAPPMEPPDEERALWLDLRRFASDRAREALFMRHAPFASGIAARYLRKRGRGDLELGDLRQLAYAGLLEAIDRFDPAHGVPFRGYATRRIVGSILTALPAMSERREQLAWKGRIERERAKSLADGDVAGRSKIERLAELAIGLAIGFMLEGTGLFVDEAPLELLGPIYGNRRPNSYDSAAWSELVRKLRSEVASLPERERTIVEAHYQADLSFEQLAELLALSKGRISQLHRAALARLSKRLVSAGHHGINREGGGRGR